MGKHKGLIKITIKNVFGIEIKHRHSTLNDVDIFCIKGDKQIMDDVIKSLKQSLSLLEGDRG